MRRGGPIFVAMLLVTGCADVGGISDSASEQRPQELAQTPTPSCKFPIHRVVAGEGVTIDASALTDPAGNPVESEFSATFSVTDVAAAEEICTSSSPSNVLVEGFLSFDDYNAILPGNDVVDGHTVSLRLRIPHYYAFVLLEPTTAVDGVETVTLTSDVWIAM